MKRMAVVGFVVLALVAGACSRNTTARKETGNTFRIDVDHHTQTDTTAFLAYFPSELKAHPGDTLHFVENWSGEPHTVTFGSIIDKAFAKIPAEPKDEDFEKIFELPEVQAVPQFFPFGPNAPKPGEKPKPIQRGAQPCFIDVAPAAPSTDACPKAEQPAFKGTQALYSSGFLPENATFDVKLDPSIAPGTYNWMCLVHSFEMKGKVEVLAAATAVDSPKDVAAKTAAEIAGHVAKLKAAGDALKPAAGEVLAGAVAEEIPGSFAAFSPTDISVGIGDTVTWKVVDFHTISFNAPTDATPDVVVAADGTVDFNPAWRLPQGGPGFPDAFGDTEGAVSADGGTWNGEGFRSSGSAGGGPDEPAVFKLAFSKAGTYKYICLIHPDMEGTVTVA